MASFLSALATLSALSLGGRDHKNFLAVRADNPRLAAASLALACALLTWVLALVSLSLLTLPCPSLTCFSILGSSVEELIVFSL